MKAEEMKKLADDTNGIDREFNRAMDKIRAIARDGLYETMLSNISSNDDVVRIIGNRLKNEGFYIEECRDRPGDYLELKVVWRYS
ncbi:MAG: hypothetical protein WC523_03825 [Patescibacteria group bacterium]